MAPITPASARAVGPARETEDVNLVGYRVVGILRVPVERQERQPALHVVAQAGAEHSAHETVDRAAAAHAGVIVDDLGGTVLGD